MHISHLCGIVAVLLYYEGTICCWIVERFLDREFAVQKNTSHATLNNFTLYDTNTKIGIKHMKTSVHCRILTLQVQI